jgi:hypothetical protein
MLNDKPYNYTELRTAITEELISLINYEFPIQQAGEFDWESLEVTTDHILRLIIRQGGHYADK